MKIAVDAMGGDNGSKPIVEAIKEFLKENKDVEIIAFGKEEELQELSSICRVVKRKELYRRQDEGIMRSYVSFSMLWVY